MHIQQLESVQRRATKYILNYFSPDYKSSLTKLSYYTTSNALLDLNYVHDLLQ